ncbi:hypothetical protein AVEN_14717-1 [Araneus ventricosus]|uniref:Uncharacterized protein n=1 Tax=Araneus ventricosus TaxID=182803 RepID=A0A4Y2F340_ARAVE|nr:hypothetical protein AVEN_14717-1 [Araneus ventricosus]
MVLSPFKQYYDGPYPVFIRRENIFCLDIIGKQVSTSFDRCTPAFLLKADDVAQLPELENQTSHPSVKPTSTASTPTVSAFQFSRSGVRSLSKVGIVATGRGMCSV